MRQAEDYPLRTSFQVIDHNDKVMRTVHRDSCFRAAKTDIKNRDAKYIKYFAWFKPISKEHTALRDRYMEVLWKLPFFSDCVVEHTGWNVREDLGGRDNRINNKDLDDKPYFLVDVREPMNRGFTVLQILRNIQESPNRLRIFGITLERTGNELAAFVASLVYYSEESGLVCNGHSPVNKISLQWAIDFSQDSSLVNYQDHLVSDLLGGSVSDRHINFDSFCNIIKSGKKLSHYVAVYGTLRKGQGNHRLIKQSIDSGNAVDVNTWPVRAELNATLRDTGMSFPALVPDKTKHGIMVEQYLVDDDTFKRLDGLEGYPHHYNRTRVEINGVFCWIYYYEKDQGLKKITSGDWVLYKDQGTTRSAYESTTAFFR